MRHHYTTCESREMAATTSGGGGQKSRDYWPFRPFSRLDATLLRKFTSAGTGKRVSKFFCLDEVTISRRSLGMVRREILRQKRLFMCSHYSGPYITIDAMRKLTPALQRQK
jgi:hypothetical protein